MKRLPDKFHRYEYAIYVFSWLLVYLIPLMEYYWASSKNIETEGYSDVFRSWIIYTPFLLLFLLHNFVLFPWLFNRKRNPLLYTLAMSVVVIAFVFGWGAIERKFIFPHLFNDKHLVEKVEERHLHSKTDNPPFRYHDLKPERRFRPHRPGPFDVPWMLLFSRLAFALLVVSFNACIRLAFQSLRREKDVQKLEKEKLRAELDYLKYQINPHFYMNTLNNIHALIDINPAQAQDAVLQLSKLMRYVLYDASQSVIALSSELRFLHNYILLMRLRYSDKVTITEQYPEEASLSIKIPSMLFANYVENAFKHGVSYQHDSFIHVSVYLQDDWVVMEVANSVWGATDNHPAGIGLANARKRLDLIYGDKYNLHIDTGEQQYKVTLKIPKLC